MTHHSLERTKERARLNTDSSLRMIKRAYDRGLGYERYHSRERDFMLQRSGTDHVALAYNNFCFIFSNEGICITMFPLPEWFGKKKFYTEKKQIRNAKKYICNYQMSL